MKALVVLAVCAGCIDDVDQRWQLDHDRIVAVRSTPPHIAVDEVAILDALVAHKAAPTDLEVPIAATAAPSNPPADLFTAVHFELTKWEVDGRLVTDTQLADARAALMLPADAPVPLEVTIQFRGPAGVPLLGTKTVYLGDSRDNPTLPPVTIAGVTPGASLTIPIDVDVPLDIDVDAAWKVSWLTSCGTLHDDDEHHAFVHVGTTDRKDGELAVVVRDPGGGVVWQVWPIVAQ